MIKEVKSNPRNIDVYAKKLT